MKDVENLYQDIDTGDLSDYMFDLSQRSGPHFDFTPVPDPNANTQVRPATSLHLLLDIHLHSPFQGLYALLT